MQSVDSQLGPAFVALEKEIWATTFKIASRALQQGTETFTRYQVVRVPLRASGETRGVTQGTVNEKPRQGHPYER